jgi:hypothetical protein
MPFVTMIIGCKMQLAEKNRIYHQPRERKVNLTNGWWEIIRSDENPW